MNEKYKKLEKTAQSKLEMIETFEHEIFRRKQWKQMLINEIDEHYKEMEKIQEKYSKEAT